MGRSLFLALLIVSNFAFTQNLGGMRGFEKLDNNDYFLRCSTEEEAIHKRNVAMDYNNMDTLRLNYYRGDNPVALNYLKKDKSSDKVIVSFIIKHEDKFDIWFVEIEDKDTYFLTVPDKNGNDFDIVYRKP